MITQGHVQNGVVVLPGDVRLPEGQKVMVIVEEQVKNRSHSVMDIPTLDLGKILKPLNSDDDDILGEMLEDRRI